MAQNGGLRPSPYSVFLHESCRYPYQVAFVRVLGRFPRQAPLEIDGEILRFTALQLGN